MLTRSTYFLLAAFLISSTVALQGCGVPGPGGGRTADLGDEPFVPVTILPLSIRVNEEMANRGLDEDGLNTVDFISTTKISLVALDEDKSRGGPATIPEHYIARDVDDNYEIQFTDPFSGELGLAIRVVLPNGEILMAPAANLQSNDINTITIDVFSDYVFDKLYATLSSEEDLDAIRPCNEDGCSDQSFMKMNLINNITQSLQAYESEIGISNDATAAEIQALFEQNFFIKEMVENAVHEVVKEANPYQVSQVDLLDPDSAICAVYARDYHTVWFGLQFNQLLPESSQDIMQFATVSSSLARDAVSDSERSFDYPLLSLSTDSRDSRWPTTNPSGRNHFSKESLSIDPDDALTLDKSEPVRQFDSSSTSTYFSNEGFLLYDRTHVFEDPTSSDNVGRRFNPHYSKLYKANPNTCGTDLADYGETPTWLIGSNLISGSSYELEVVDGELVETEDGLFVRQEQLDLQNIFSWEIHGRETDTSSFRLANIEGKEFGALTFSTELDDSGEILGVFAETLFWEVDNGDVQESQPDAFYRTYHIARNDDQSVTTLSESTITPITRSIYTLPTQNFKENSPQEHGLIGLNGGAEPSFGHATQNGQHLTFNLDSFDLTTDKGRGILIATELRDTGDRPKFTFTDQDNDTVNSEYSVSGNIVSLTSNNNSIFNLNNSQLTLEDDGGNCIATLSLIRQGVEHDVTTNELSSPSKTSPEVATSSSCQTGSLGNGAEIEITFDNVNGSALTLKGFATKQGQTDSSALTPSAFIPMVWLQSNSLGLIFATLDQTTDDNLIESERFE